MTFKYRFILSFVLLEIFFILLIVVTNFMAIKNSTNNLINQSINSNVKLIEELIKIPLSKKDNQTLNNLFLNSDKSDYINTIIVVDNQSNLLTTKYNFNYVQIDDILKIKGQKVVNYGNETFVVFKKEIYEDEYFLGSVFIIFDTSKSSQLIEENKMLTYLIILIEIIISTILSYLIGHKLTVMLNELTSVSKQIGLNKNPKIPYQDRIDEIGVLSRSMNTMLDDLKNRNRKLKELGSELRKQKNDLIQANIHKDQFLANMSHELKTPLNSINVISSVMMKNKQGKLDDKQVKNLQIINSCGNELLYLINDILDISKIEAGELNLNIEKVSMHKIFEDIKDLFEPQILEKNLNLVINIDENIDYIMSDQIRIKQIIKNLLSNSIKFTNRGSITLSAKAIDNNNFEIIVKDDGIGITQEKLENIFDRFKQGDGNINRKYGGTGLGLSICKELSKMLKGDINVHSSVGVGTTFIVTLSKNIQSGNQILNTLVNNDINKTQNNSKFKEFNSVTTKIEKSADKKVSIKSVDKKESSAGIKRKILLLNQDPLTFMQFVIELKKEYDLVQVNDLEQFNTKLESNYFDLLIVDVSKLICEDLYESIKDKDLNILLISSHIEDIEDNLIAKSNYVFKKPFEKQNIKEEIEKIFA